MLVMDHAEATRKLAVEQYLLGELSEPEREEFEQHVFSCAECVEALEAGTAFVANARAVFREEAAFGRAASAVQPKRWSFAAFWTGWRLAPAAALAGWAVAGVLVGYQFLRAPSESSQLVLAPAISVQATRAGQALTFSRKKGTIALTVPHEWEEAYSAYQGEIERAADHRVLLSSKVAASGPEGAPFAVSIQPGRLQTGSYLLTVYGLREGSAAKTALERIPFTLME